MPASPLEDGELTPEPRRPAGSESPGSGCPTQYDRRSGSRRAGEDAVCREQRHDPRRADLASRPSDSRVDSHRHDDWRSRHDDWRSEPRRDQRRGDGAGKAPEDNRAPLCGARGEFRQGFRPSARGNHGAGDHRPSVVQIQLNKRIVGARDFEDILAIVEVKHGEFDAVNAATACNRLAKAARCSANSATIDDLPVQALFRAISRVGPSMKPQEVSNTIWGLATLGWQPGQGPMRGALEAAAVRVAPTMDAQNVANTIWGDRKSVV